MGRNSRRPYEVDKLQRGLESVTKYVEDSKIRIYFQRKEIQAKMTWIFSKGNYYYLEEKNEKYTLKSLQFLMPRFMEA